METTVEVAETDNLPGEQFAEDLHRPHVVEPLGVRPIRGYVDITLGGIVEWPLLVDRKLERENKRLPTQAKG